MKENKLKRNDRGITLIALVVTIVVLLILAGVSLSMLSGENGTITKAQDSKIETRIGDIEETAEIIRGEYVTTSTEETMILGEQPTARYIIEELIKQGKIVESEVIDYGEGSGIGVLKVEGRKIQIQGKIGDIALLYDVDNETIRLYPIIKSSETYGDFAVQQIIGKTDAQICQLFVEGYNYRNVTEERGEPEYNNINELMDYWKSQNWIDESCSTSDELAGEYGYNSLIEMGIDWRCFNLEQYSYPTQVVQRYTIYCANSDQTISGTTRSPFYRYITEGEGIYEFTLTVNGESVTVKIDITDVEDYEIFRTDGNGTIIGINNRYLDWDSEGCWTILKVNITEIPEYIGDEKITAIGEYAFSEIYGIEQLTLPDSIVNLGEGAFYSCYDLESIELSENIKQIPEYCFSYTALKEMPVSDEIISIGTDAFSSCGNLTTITIPNRMTEIADYTFFNCDGVTSITIPENITSIGEGAFENCDNLKSVTLPSGINEIRYFTFSRCTSLTSITIPDSVTSIGKSAFFYCKVLKSVTMGENVTSIGDSSFKYCYYLNSLTIPSSLISIGGSAFDYCTRLTSIVIPESVETIGSRAFNTWTSSQRIYCEAESQPSGWSESWNYNCSAKITWGYTS